MDIEIERRYTRSAVTTSARATSSETGGGQALAGYGAVFYDGTPETEYVLWEYPGQRAVERILPGAFDAVLRAGPDCRCLFNHDANLILGRTTNGTVTLRTDKRGLLYHCELAATTTARDVFQHVKRGDVTGSSFSFSLEPDGESWRVEKLPDGTALTIRDIARFSALWDVSPCTYPAYAGTTAGLRVGSAPETFTRPPGSDRWTLAQIKKRADEVRRELIRDYKRRANEVAAACAADAHAHRNMATYAGRRGGG